MTTERSDKLFFLNQMLKRLKKKGNFNIFVANNFYFVNQTK